MRPKLLYLGFAFPPGVAGLFPEAQPAGHLIETSLIDSLRPTFDIRSVGTSWIEVEHLPATDGSVGLPHALNLLEKRPELMHRRQSLARLKAAYEDWVRSGWTPDLILMCNFSPVYNAFIRWLASRPQRPCVVLYLADSMGLQRPLRWFTKLRYFFKPLKWSDPEMVPFVDGCVAVSRATEDFFSKRGLPWLWLPNGCDPRRALQPGDLAVSGPVQFGYFGTLAPHGGAPALLRVFTARPRAELLHICGFGKGRPAMAELCRRHPQVRFHEPRTPDQCIALAAQWDVLLNPRPIVPGNENNFSSKVFEYALTGRPLLTSRLSGTEVILGEEAFYFDATDFERSLEAGLSTLAQISRAELNRRGAAIQRRLLTEYAWPVQGKRLAAFLSEVLAARSGHQQNESRASSTAGPVQNQKPLMFANKR